MKTTIQKSFELQDLALPLTAASNDSHQDTTNQDDDEMMVVEKDQHSTLASPHQPRNGTINGSIFAMVTGALGPGCLTLPFMVDRLGLTIYVLVILGCAALSYMGMYFMERVIVRYKVNTYSQMVSCAFGDKVTKFAEILLIAYPYAVTISVQVVFSKFIAQLMTDVFGFNLFSNRALEEYNAAGTFVRVLIALIHVALNYRNFFQEDIKEMLIRVGKFSVSGYVFCLVCILITAFVGFSKFVDGNLLSYDSILSMDWSKAEYVKHLDMMLLLQSISAIFYTFANPQFIFPLLNRLQTPTKKRVDSIFVYSHYCLLVIYLVIGVVGYLFLSQHLDIVPISSLIITSMPTPPLLLGKLILSGALFFMFPLQVSAARQLSYETFNMERTPENTKKFNYIMVGTTCLIGIIFQQVTMYFGFMGGAMGVLLTVTIPAFCMRRQVSSTKIDSVLFYIAMMMSMVLFIGAVISLITAS